MPYESPTGIPDQRLPLSLRNLSLEPILSVPITALTNGRIFTAQAARKNLSPITDTSSYIFNGRRSEMGGFANLVSSFCRPADHAGKALPRVFESVPALQAIHR